MTIKADKSDLVVMMQMMKAMPIWGYLWPPRRRWEPAENDSNPKNEPKNLNPADAEPA